MGQADPAEPVEQPIACTLGPGDGPERMRRWQALAEVAHPVARRHGRTLEVSFEPGSGVRAELTALAAAEQDCCSFVDWTVSERDGHPLLCVSANPDSPDDVAPIAALFGAT